MVRIIQLGCACTEPCPALGNKIACERNIELHKIIRTLKVILFQTLFKLVLLLSKAAKRSLKSVWKVSVSDFQTPVGESPILPFATPQRGSRYFNVVKSEHRGGGGGGSSHIWAIRVCAAQQGVPGFCFSESGTGYTNHPFLSATGVYLVGSGTGSIFFLPESNLSCKTAKTALNRCLSRNAKRAVLFCGH